MVILLVQKRSEFSLKPAMVQLLESRSRTFDGTLQFLDLAAGSYVAGSNLQRARMGANTTRPCSEPDHVYVLVCTSTPDRRVQYWLVGLSCCSGADFRPQVLSTIVATLPAIYRV